MEGVTAPAPVSARDVGDERAENGQGAVVSPAARVLLYELNRAGPSREFVRLYHESLDELTPDDLRTLNLVLAQRPRRWLDVLSQAQFWGWRRWLAALTGRAGRA